MKVFQRQTFALIALFFCLIFLCSICFSQTLLPQLVFLLSLFSFLALTVFLLHIHPLTLFYYVSSCLLGITIGMIVFVVFSFLLPDKVLALGIIYALFFFSFFLATFVFFFSKQFLFRKKTLLKKNLIFSLLLSVFLLFLLHIIVFHLFSEQIDAGHLVFEKQYVQYDALRGKLETPFPELNVLISQNYAVLDDLIREHRNSSCFAPKCLYEKANEHAKTSYYSFNHALTLATALRINNYQKPFEVPLNSSSLLFSQVEQFNFERESQEFPNPLLFAREKNLHVSDLSAAYSQQNSSFLKNTFFDVLYHIDLVAAPLLTTRELIKEETLKAPSAISLLFEHRHQEEEERYKALRLQVILDYAALVESQ